MAQRRSPKERLLDIEMAISKIEAFLAEKDFAAFESEAMLHDAIVRNLSVISEASRFLSEELKLREPDVPWRSVADMGNWLRHGYDMVDDRILWDTIRLDLPALKAAVLRLLSTNDIAIK
jgi:uncharacterized protein with HEPN domain